MVTPRSSKLQQSSVVAIEPWETNNNMLWPPPTIVNVKNGNISLDNATNDPIYLGRDVKKCKIVSTEVPKDQNSNYYQYCTPPVGNDNNHNVAISVDHITCQEAKQLIGEAHTKYAVVFDKDLSQGYNNFYGKHECGLNWASAERPLASKVHVPSYNHDLKVLQQELMDDLTNQPINSPRT